jgi:hypothetical protein
MKQEHVLSCQVARYLRMRGYVTIDCDVMSALKYLPVQDSRNRAMFVASRKSMAYTLGQCDVVVINKYGNVSFLELKNGTVGKQSDNQKYFEQEIKCRGGNYVLIRNMDDCVAFVNRDLVEPVKARFQANITNIWTDINNGSVACSPAQKALPPFKDIKE